MMLTEETPIADGDLPLDAFKAHLRMGSGFGVEDTQDGILTSFLRAAIATIEARTGKVLLQRVFSVSLDSWPSDNGVVFPVAPVTDVTLVETVERDGVRSVVDDSLYWLQQDAQQPKLRSTTTLPGMAVDGATLAIRFEAGFAANWADLPADLRQAVLMLAAHYYEYRNDTGLSGGCTPFGVSSLIARYRALRLGVGSTT